MNLGDLIACAIGAREGYPESTEVVLVDHSGDVIPVERFLIGAKLPEAIPLILLVSSPEEKPTALDSLYPGGPASIPVVGGLRQVPVFLGEEDEEEPEPDRLIGSICSMCGTPVRAFDRCLCRPDPAEGLTDGE
jgi:hypothetical protein